MKKQFTLIATVALLAGSALFTSCKKEEVAKKYARLNVVQTSPDAPGFNVLLDTSTINSFVLLYGSNTGYLQVEEGAKVFRVNTFRVDSLDTLVTKADVALKENADYSLFIIDSFKKLSTLLVQDDLKNPSGGNAMVRFVHLSPNAPRLDVITETSHNIVFGNMAFKDVTGFTEMKAGVYDWELRGAGSDRIVAKLPTMVFNTGKIYTVYTHGFDYITGKKSITSSVIINRY